MIYGVGLAATFTVLLKMHANVHRGGERWTARRQPGVRDPGGLRAAQDEWQRRQLSRRAQEDLELPEQVKAIFKGRAVGLRLAAGTPSAKRDPLRQCWVDAVIEAFWSTLKVELVRGYPWATRAPPRQAIFEWIGSFHNLRCLSPHPLTLTASAVKGHAIAALYTVNMSGRPETRYARSGEAHIAYQVLGEGPVDLVLVPGLISHLDLEWESVAYRRFIRQLATLARLIRYDKRGTGLSDPVPTVPTLDQRVDDLGAVLKATGAAHAVLFGYSDGGPTAIQFAAHAAERTLGMILYGTAGGGMQMDFAERLRNTVRDWGQGGTLKLLAPSLAPSPAQLETRAAFERSSASPAMAAALVEGLIRADVRSLLAMVAVPTLVLHRRDDVIPVERGRYLAEHIPGAEYVELDGVDHMPWIGDADAVVAAVERFLRRIDGQRRPALRARQPRSARAATGWASLTEAEHAVAMLLTEGLSNPAIASRLFISRHTVESHLKHIFSKLGLSSRGELAALVRREQDKKH